MKKGAKILILSFILLILVIGVVIVFVRNPGRNQEKNGIPKEESIEVFFPEEEFLEDDLPTDLPSSDNVEEQIIIDENNTETQDYQADNNYLPEDSFD